jgi:hypothetical protein
MLVHFTLRGFLVAIACAALIFAFINVLRVADKDTLRSSCDGHLSHIAHALMDYKDAQGSLPPAFKKDANGKAMHSWRVLLLPYLGYENLYSQYDLTEPWNGPNNSKLLAKMPAVYKCPASDLSKFRTPYLALKSTVDSETIGVDTTLIVEDTLQAVNWMEPTDINSEALQKDVQKGPYALSSHGGGIGIVNSDCRPQRK